MEEQEVILKEEPELLKKWDKRYGDRITELVMIGIDMDRDEIETSLNLCLLTDAEMQQNWSQFNDPLPAFDVTN